MQVFLTLIFPPYKSPWFRHRQFATKVWLTLLAVLIGMKPSETQWISMFIDFLSLSAWAFRDGFHLHSRKVHEVHGFNRISHLKSKWFVFSKWCGQRNWQFVALKSQTTHQCMPLPACKSKMPGYHTASRMPLCHTKGDLRTARAGGLCQTYCEQPTQGENCKATVRCAASKKK